jgi:hypothetical protein
MGLFIKIIIVVLFIGLIISLTSSLIFLLKDVQSQQKRGLYALGIRLGLASILMATIFFGLSSGYLGSNAPWDKKMSRDQLKQIQLQQK